MARRPAVACPKVRVLGFAALFVTIVVVGSSQSLAQGRTHPPGPPFPSGSTLLPLILTDSYASLHHGLFALLVGGARLVEPAQVVRWSWLTPVIGVGLAGPSITLLAPTPTVLTGPVRISGFLGAG